MFSSTHHVILLIRTVIGLISIGLFLWFAYITARWRGLFRAILGFALLLVFIIWFDGSLYCPYIAPHYWIVTCWYILAPLLGLFFYILGYWIKPEKFNRDLWEKNLVKQGKSKFSKWFVVTFAPALLAVMLVFVIYLVPVAPTKHFANHFFQHNITIQQVICIHGGRRSIPHTEFIYLDESDFQKYDINFPYYFCYQSHDIENNIPNTLKFILHGREWVLGKFVDAIEYADGTGYLVN